MSWLDRALAELSSALGADAHVWRTEVGKDGRLVLHVATPEGLRWFAHDERALVELSPRDERELPGLAAFLRDEPAARIVAWRPGRRLVARVVRGGRAHAVKLLRRRQAARALELHAAARASADGLFHVPAAEVAHWPEAFQLDWLDAAEELDFRRHADRFAPFGAALARWQSGSAPAGLPMHARATELDVLDRWAERYARAAAVLPEGFAAARQALGECAARSVAVESSVVAHRDLHDGQILWTPGGPALLDFDLLSIAEPELDLANLAEHCVLCGWQRARGADADRAARAADALIEGYRAQRAVDLQALAFYRAATALRLALVHGLRPRSFHLRAPLVERAHVLLAAPLEPR
ncbi:MAG: phosphotransferase [Planctomycetes bacterium]|nr:phosphotransferase [Planctomycetota bacterium]